jgi:hypothetical protein
MATMMLTGARILLVGVLSFAFVPVVAAQTLEAFYKDKTLSLIIPNAPGGSFDLYARLVANHLGRVTPVLDERGHVRMLLEEPEGAAWVAPRFVDALFAALRGLDERRRIIRQRGTGTAPPRRAAMTHAHAPSHTAA